MCSFETGQTVVRRDVHRSGRVWSKQALRVIADTGEALVTACTPGAEVRWPALYTQARADGDRSVRTKAFDAMATGRWELAASVWQETDLLLWKPPAAWFSVNSFYVPDGDGRRLRELVRQLRAAHPWYPDRVRHLRPHRGPGGHARSHPLRTPDGPVPLSLVDWPPRSSGCFGKGLTITRPSTTR